MRIEDMITEEEYTVIDISTNYPYYFYWKCIGTTNENLYFDTRV